MQGATVSFTQSDSISRNCFNTEVIALIDNYCIMSRVRKSLVDVVQEFCTSSDIERDFETFAAEYVHLFDDAGNGEHKLAYYDAYKEYLTRFEGKIERFIRLVRELFVFMPNENIDMLMSC
jgi:hypothetical protein